MSKEESTYSADFDALSPQASMELQPKGTSPVKDEANGASSGGAAGASGEEKEEKSFSSLEESKKIDAAYALLDNGGSPKAAATAAGGAGSTSAKKSTMSLPGNTSPAAAPSAQGQGQEGGSASPTAGGNSVSVNGTNIPNLGKLGLPQQSDTSPKKPAHQAAAAAAAARGDGHGHVGSPMAQKPPPTLVTKSAPVHPTSGAAHARRNGQNQPAEESKAVSRSDGAGGAGAGAGAALGATRVQYPVSKMQKGSIEFALTSKPFLDVGLSYALDNIGRITGALGISDSDPALSTSVAGGGSYFNSSNAQHSISLAANQPPFGDTDGMSDSLGFGMRSSAGGTGGSQTSPFDMNSKPYTVTSSRKQEGNEQRRGGAGGSLPFGNNDTLTSQDSNHWGDTFQKELDRNTTATAAQQNPPTAPGTDTRALNTTQNTQTTTTSMSRRQPSTKTIAGFVSEPWKTTTITDVTQPPPRELATSLLSLAEGLDATGNGAGSQAARAKVPASLVQALDDQRKSRNMEEILALAPAVGPLLNKKVLSPIKSNKMGGITTQNLGGTKTHKRVSRSGGAETHDRRKSGTADQVLMAECLELAATEAELKAALNAQIKAQLQSARQAVLDKLELDRTKEQRQEEKVIEYAEKKFEARRRIKAMQGEKGNKQAEQEASKERYREEMLREQAAVRAAKAESNIKAAKERKLAIKAAMVEKNKVMEEAVFTKIAESTQKIAEKEEMRAREQAEHAARRELLIQQKTAFAAELEYQKTAERADALNNKDENYNRVKNQQEQVNEMRITQKRTKEVAAFFRAEQRRNMLEAKKAAEQELGRIRQTAEAVLAKTRKLTNDSRSIKLNKIYAEQLTKQLEAGASVEEPLDVSPGPGEYFKNITKSINPGGGYMASSRPESLVSEVPGPGTYEVGAETGHGASGASGCIPFMSRGKTDVDWTMLRASKLPGVGQYNVAGKGKPSRSVKLNSKGTTQLDTIIEKAKKLPGPGYYNLSQDATHKAGSLEAYLLGESDVIL